MMTGLPHDQVISTFLRAGWERTPRGGVAFAQVTLYPPEGGEGWALYYQSYLIGAPRFLESDDPEEIVRDLLRDALVAFSRAIPVLVEMVGR